jgi:ankyrin repeat protein
MNSSVLVSTLTAHGARIPPSALYSACNTGNIHLVAALINNNVDLNSTNEDGYALLHSLVTKPYTNDIWEMIQLLVDKGAGNLCLQYSLNNFKIST